jgi:hypothetical protein
MASRTSEIGRAGRVQLDPEVRMATNRLILSWFVRRSFAYNRQEGFEYLGVTTGYISWIFRNSCAISP